MFKVKRWIFVPCLAPSHARAVLCDYVADNIGTRYKLGVVGATYGFYYK